MRGHAAGQVEFLVANQSSLDRGIRLGLGLTMLVVGWSGWVPEMAGVALRLLCWVPLLTGLSGWCPFYSLIGFSTRHGWRRR